MQDELNKKDNYYFPVAHEECCELLFTMEKKDNRKRAADQIKLLAASKAGTDNYDRDTSAKLPRNNKARYGILPERKHQGNKPPSILVTSITA